jgi:phospholipase/lecithinase/hemolysin
MTMVALLARVAFFSLFAPQVWSLPSTRTHITHLVVFGDSFSDNGSSSRTVTASGISDASAGTGAWEVSKNTWPVDPAYYHHEFSNGPVWVQDLASSFHWTLSDYAVGGGT